jgi:hypothetical protein
LTSYIHWNFFSIGSIINITYYVLNNMKFGFSAVSALVLGAGLVSSFAPQVPVSRFPTTTSSLNMAVSKQDSYTITLLPGDGIGPEITESTKDVLASLCKRCGFELELKEALIGGAAIDAVNDPFPDETLKQCQSSDAVLLACIGGYKVSIVQCVCVSCAYYIVLYCIRRMLSIIFIHVLT